MDNIKVIGFDADDTLWVCEPIFRNAEKKVCELLKPWVETEELLDKILQIHVSNLPLYGYGIKGYILSLTETVLEVTDGRVPGELLNKIIALGKEMLQEPIVLLNHVETVLPRLKENYKLVVATKGDLLDQQRKLEASGLLRYFDDVEIMSDKNPAEYQKMFNRLNIKPTEFMMVGNSLKSDILPVIELGAKGVHIPYEITWAHEKVEEVDRNNPLFHEISHLEELYDILN
ncbi:MAG: HAD family hydrolase [Bacteroidales bacterium]